MSETQSQDDPQPEQTRDGAPVLKPLGDSWATSEPATTDAKPKPAVRPLGDSWATSEPATTGARPKPKAKPLGDSWATGQPADGDPA